jgi:hypothetical protein
MALAPLDLLASIKARKSATFCGFDALAVDHPGRRRGLLSPSSRVAMTSIWFMACNRPVFRQA